MIRVKDLKMGKEGEKTRDPMCLVLPCFVDWTVHCLTFLIPI